MLVKFPQLKNAAFPIAVTGFPSISFGITTLASFPVYPVMVTLSPLTSYTNPSAVVSPAANTVMGSIPNTMHRDSSNMMLWISLMLASCGGVLGMLLYRRKKAAAGK